MVYCGVLMIMLMMLFIMVLLFVLFSMGRLCGL